MSEGFFMTGDHNMENNKNNKKENKLNKKLTVGVIAVLAAMLLAGCSCTGSGTKTVSSGREQASITGSGNETAPASSKDSKTESKSGKEDAAGKDAKTDGKDNKPNGSAGQNASGQNADKPGTSTQQGGTSSNNAGGNTSGGNNGGNTSPSHTHDWQPVYKNVYHQPVTESRWVEDYPAWDEPQYAYHTVCFTCGLDFVEAGFTNDDVVRHSDYHMDRGESDQYGTMQVQVGTIHHEAEGHYETVTMSEGWTEQVIDHYACSCGATK